MIAQSRALNNYSIVEYIGITCIIALFVWISFFPQPIQEKYHLVTNIFLILAFAITLYRKHTSVFKLNDYPLWIFLVAISINVFFAQQQKIALKTYWDIAIPMFCIYYIVSESIITDKQFDTLSKFICILSIIVSFWGLMDFLLHTNWLYEYYIPNHYYQRCTSREAMRAISTQFWSPPLGSYLIASFPFSLLLIQQNRLFFRILGFIGTILCSVVIIMTLSRGVFLGFIAMVLFILYVNKKRHLLVIFFIIFCLFILICAYLRNPLNKLGFKQLLFLGSWAAFSEYRFQRGLMAFQMLKDHPLAGLGFQHFRILFNEYYTGKGIIPYEFRIADNMYLTLLAETGILGFAGFLVFIFSVIKKAWRKITAVSDASSSRQQLVFVFSALIGLLVNMGAYELFYWPNQYIYICILIGLIGNFSRNKIIKKVK